MLSNMLPQLVNPYSSYYVVTELMISPVTGVTKYNLWHLGKAIIQLT